MSDFIPFPKISRLRRPIVITEKIDGTNSCVRILEDGRVLAQSRNRFITPESDNYGFAAWVKEHETELRFGLGEGAHFGEWWGSGIQRRYGLTEKRFSLFNVGRWTRDTPPPACCAVVPKLYEGPWSEQAIEHTLWSLRETGSSAVPGFMNPEGIVVFHSASSSMFKVLLENDDKAKGEVAA